MTVYADVLIAVNYAVNLLLLVMAARLLGIVTSRRRLCLAALLGAMGSLVIFLPYYSFFWQLLCKGLLSAGMAAVICGIRPYQKLIRGILGVTTVSLLFAGVMLALQFTLAPGGMVVYNGIVYFNISAMQLVVWTALAYGLLYLIERLFFGRTQGRALYRITVDAGGRQISFDALADTGNTLKEPFSGAPVIVCDGALASVLHPEEPERFRLIPCSTVIGGGALEGFRPDEVLIRGGGLQWRTKDVYIAKSREPIEGEYRAVFHPSLVDGNMM